MKNKKIFIQIASYRDPELLPTLRDCIAMAKHPENLVFSIAWQHSPDDEWDNLNEYKNDDRFRIIDINYKDSKGVCWARNQIQQKYDGEEYTFQLDSHHRFIKNWDAELITMYEQLKQKGYDKPLLTGYVTSYDPENDPQGRSYVPWKMNFDRYTPDGVVFFAPSGIDNYKDLTEPILGRFYSAHFAFTTGDFVKEVPHDPDYFFHGEEISITVRAYTWGYDIFHPHKVIAWHEYTRKGRRKIWDDSSNWGERDKMCLLRNRKFFEMDGEVRDIDFGIYDLGTIRTLEDYERYSGLSFKRRSVQQYTLDNKPAPNPPLYGDELQNSFVRLFKHCIDVSHELVPEKDYDFWAVALHGGDDNKTLFRRDTNKNEIKRLLNDPDKYCKIWVEFQTSIQPEYWVVWPHSESKGWCNRLTGKL